MLPNGKLYRSIISLAMASPDKLSTQNEEWGGPKSYCDADIPFLIPI